MSISFDRIADDYDRTRDLPKKKMEEVVEALKKEFFDCSNILDIGVGTGRFALPLQKAGLRVVGIDISERMLTKAHEKGAIHLIRANAEKMPFQNKSFDACLSVHFLHLVAGWRQVLSEMERVTEKKYVALCYKHHSKHSDALRREYYSLIESMGHKRTRPGVGETELGDRVKPDRIEWVTTVKETLLVKKAIEGLERRICSSMWDVPEDVHRRAIETLKERFTQKTTSHTYTMGLSVWNVERLKEVSQT